MACSVCGCEGFHACPGHKLAPWTPEKIAELRRVLEQYRPEGAENSSEESEA